LLYRKSRNEKIRDPPTPQPQHNKAPQYYVTISWSDLLIPKTAQTLEPILFPKLRIYLADFPCLHCSIGLEATHLGDLMRLCVRPGVKIKRTGSLKNFDIPKRLTHLKLLISLGFSRFVCVATLLSTT